MLYETDRYSVEAPMVDPRDNVQSTDAAKLRLIRRARALAEEMSAIDHNFEDSFAPRVLIDNHDLLRQIHSGGQGVVYLARRRSDKMLVAVKTLRDGALADSARRERFLKEARILASISHPNIVPILQHGRTEAGLDFLTMPFIDGETLDPAALAASMPALDRLKLFAVIASAVHAAHASGVVHRDLKPSNVRIDTSGQPHVLDFGLAMTTASIDAVDLRRTMTVTGEFIGTLMWASPEQICGEAEITPASDVFSLGVLLHQLMSGGSFPPQTFANLAGATRPTGSDRATGKLKLEPKLPQVNDRRLRVIITCALKQSPGARYSNAGELAAAVEAYLLRPPTPARTRRILWAAGLLLVGAVIGSGASWMTRPVDPREEALALIRNGGINSIGIEFSRPPAGSYRAGPNALAPNIKGDEVQHDVQIPRPFLISQFEIRQKHFERLMGFNPSKFVGEDLPVERVTLAEAQEFCRRLSVLEKKTYRLPTEWEWEYACRAGTTTDWSFGDDPNLMYRYGNVLDQSNTDRIFEERQPWNDRFPWTSYGEFYPNAWGISNMHGNVWEWCQPPFQRDPTDPSTVIIDTAPIRGGSWYDSPHSCRSWHRNPVSQKTQNDNIGFRIVCEIPEEKK